MEKIETFYIHLSDDQKVVILTFLEKKEQLYESQIKKMVQERGMLAAGVTRIRKALQGLIDQHFIIKINNTTYALDPDFFVSWFKQGLKYRLDFVTFRDKYKTETTLEDFYGSEVVKFFQLHSFPESKKRSGSSSQSQ